MTSMHGREKKPVAQTSEASIYESLQEYWTDDVRTELLAPKKYALNGTLAKLSVDFKVATKAYDDSRMHWLEYIKGELALPASKEKGNNSVFEEILELCLSSVKKPELSTLAARVATLSVLWNINVSESMVEARLMALVEQWKTRGDRLSFFLSCVICLLATSDKMQEKVVETIMNEHVVPVINREADRVIAKMSGEVVEEESDVNDDAPTLEDYIVEFLEAWQVCVALLDKAVAVEKMKDIISSLIGLFDHEADVVRIAASQCVLTIVDLAERYDVEDRFEEDFVEAEKTISRVAYDHDVEWSGEEGKTRKAFEAMGELIKERVSVVTVDLITISGAPARHTAVKGSEFRHYEANANRKGHPVAGYADAAIIQYFASHLGHHFTDLFSVNNIHLRRDNTRTYNAMYYFLTRHQAARSAATQIDAIHSYGDGAFTASRSFISNLESRRRRHRKVKVADYL